MVVRGPYGVERGMSDPDPFGLWATKVSVNIDLDLDLRYSPWMIEPLI